MKKEQIYNCVYYDGGGTEYPEGQWQITTFTIETMIVTKITKREIYHNYRKGDKIKCSKNSGNPLRKWSDGSFTIYPKQAGVPFVFEPAEVV